MPLLLHLLPGLFWEVYNNNRWGYAAGANNSWILMTKKNVFFLVKLYAKYCLVVRPLLSQSLRDSGWWRLKFNTCSHYCHDEENARMSHISNLLLQAGSDTRYFYPWSTGTTSLQGEIQSSDVLGKRGTTAGTNTGYWTLTLCLPPSIHCLQLAVHSRR